MSDTLIHRAAQELQRGSPTPFADVAESYSDAELCALSMKAKDFLADCLHDEALRVLGRNNPIILAVLAIGIAAVVLLLMGHTWSAVIAAGVGHAILWRARRTKGDTRSADQLKRVVGWMKYENQVTRASMEGLK